MDENDTLPPALLLNKLKEKTRAIEARVVLVWTVHHVILIYSVIHFRTRL